MDDARRETGTEPPAPAAPPPDPGRAKAWVAFAGFFFLMAGYYLLKPVRDAVFLHRKGFDRQPLFDVYVVIGSLIVVTGYNIVVRYVSRRVLLAAGFSVFIAGTAVCAVLLKGGATDPASVFYVGLNLFWMLLLTIYWSTVNDVFGVETGRRWYGLIALAGPPGALAGSAAALTLVQKTGDGSVNLLRVSLPLFGAAFLLALVLDAMGRRHPPAEPPRVAAPPVFPDVRLLFRSRYVLAIAGMMALGVFVMTIFLLDFNRLLTEYAPTESGKTEWGARRSLLENGLGILIQLGITPVLLKRYGPGPGLVVLPLLAMAGGLAMASQEVFLVGFAVIAGTQGVAYTLNQSSKELLYVPTDRSLKYQAKALVDVFCFRLGQVVASLLVLGWRSLFPKTYWPLLLLAIGASVAWLGFARAAGRAFNEATREKPGNPVPACEAGGASGA